MKVLVLNSYVDQTKYARQFENLCNQVKKGCDADVEKASYQDFDAKYLGTKRGLFDGIVLSGTEALFSKPDQKAKFSSTIKAVEAIDLPLLGICGGHQLIGMAYGVEVGNLGKTIKSYNDVNVLVDDPIFEGLAKTISVWESHEEMVERLPADFQLLAQSESTSIEAFKKSNGILYGVQFHPERNDVEHPAGATVLSNFGRLLKR